MTEVTKVNVGELVDRLHDSGFELEIEAADAIKELVEALKPFAKLHVDDGDYSDTDVSTYEDNTVRAADVRRARALVAKGWMV